jgi:hypothetical protein
VQERGRRSLASPRRLTRRVAPQAAQPVEELVPGIVRADRPRPDANGTNGTWSGTVTHAPAGEAFEWVFGLDFVAEGGAADTVLNMVENGTTVATTTIETPTLIKIDYTGGPPPAEAG